MKRFHKYNLLHLSIPKGYKYIQIGDVFCGETDFVWWVGNITYIESIMPHFSNLVGTINRTRQDHGNSCYIRKIT